MTAVIDDYASTTATGGAITVGGSTTGNIETAGDTDWFRVTLTTGHSYVFNLEGSATSQGTLADPFLRLRDSAGNPITNAFDDDSGTGLNSRFNFTSTSTGTYYLAAGSAASSGTGTYKMSVADTTVIADDYASTTATTGAITVGGSKTGNIETAGDNDWFRVTLTAGHTYRFDLEGSATAQGTLADPIMSLRDSSGASLMFGDDGGTGFNTRFSFSVTSTGTYYLAAGSFDASATGTYKMSVTVDETLTGTSGNDTLTGHAGDDQLSGLGGNDSLNAADGDDSLYGAAGADTLNGGNGNDWLDGGDGNDSLIGGAGFDFANYGSDLSGTGVNASLATGLASGGGGNDTLTGIEALYGSKYADTLTGSDGNDALYGGDGNDSLYGGKGNDTIVPGLGVDTVNGSDGVDALVLGLSSSSYQVSQPTAGVTRVVNSASGVDVTFSNVETVQFTDVWLSHVDGTTAIDVITGSTGDDWISGYDGADSLNGDSGNDLLDGGDGNDTLLGFFGNDTLLGGAGNDFLSPSFGDDLVDGGAGIDTVNFETVSGPVNASLATGLTFGSGGAGNDTLTGIENLEGTLYNDTLTGDANANTLTAMGGDDRIDPGTGVDTVDGGDGTDVLVLGLSRASYQVSQPSAGITRLVDSAAGVDVSISNVESVQFSDGTVALAALTPNHIDGTSGSDTLSGTSGNDTITGFAGNDSLSGGDGNDSIDAGDGNDSLYGGKGNDALNGGAGFDITGYDDASNGVNANLATGAVSGGAGNDTLTGIEGLYGSKYADTLRGSDGNDYLNGGSGNDSLYGGKGSDTLDAGTGVDTVDGGDGTDVLVVGLSRASYQVSQPSAGVTRLVDSAASVDVTISNVENVQFSDGTVAVANLNAAQGTGFHVVLSDAATSLGLNDQSSSMFTGAPGSGLATLGFWVSTHTSWGAGQLSAGQSGTIGVVYSSGYTIALTFTLNSSVAATLTEIDLLSPLNVPVLTYSGSIAVTPASLLVSLSDSFVLAGGDTITGNAANNRLQGYGGNDTINGGGGIDTAVFSGSHTGYSITQTSTGFTVSGADGTDQLTSIERLQFADGDVAFDLTGTAGEAYRLYQAAFNRVPDLAGLGFQINDLDTKSSLQQVATNFIASPEFQLTYGNLNDTQFITLLYQNVLHRAPDSGGLAFHLNEIATGQSRAEVLMHFSESPENQANVLGAITNGIFYYPYTG